jgi:hypothetical protein
MSGTARPATRPGLLGRGGFGSVYSADLFRPWKPGRNLYRNFSADVEDHHDGRNCDPSVAHLEAVPQTAAWLDHVAFKYLHSPKGFDAEFVACVQLMKLTFLRGPLAQDTTTLMPPRWPAPRPSSTTTRKSTLYTLSWCDDERWRSVVPRALIPFRRCETDALTLFDRDPNLGPEDVMTMLTTFCMFCDTVHAGGYCHADIKLANVMVNTKPDPRPSFFIHDFGLLGSAESTMNRAWIGTARYWSIIFDSPIVNAQKRADWVDAHGHGVGDALCQSMSQESKQHRWRRAMFRAVDFHAMAHSLLEYQRRRRGGPCPLSRFCLAAAAALLVHTPFQAAEQVFEGLCHAYEGAAGAPWPPLRHHVWADKGHLVTAHPVSAPPPPAVHPRVHSSTLSGGAAPSSAYEVASQAVERLLRAPDIRPIRGSKVSTSSGPSSGRRSLSSGPSSGRSSPSSSPSSSQSSSPSSSRSSPSSGPSSRLLPRHQQVHGTELYDDDPTILDVAARTGKTAAEVVDQVNRHATRLLQAALRPAAATPPAAPASRASMHTDRLRDRLTDSRTKAAAGASRASATRLPPTRPSSRPARRRR